MNIKEALALLKKCGIVQICLDFSGCGDSGQMDGYLVSHKNGTSMYGASFDFKTFDREIHKILPWIESHATVEEFDTAVAVVGNAGMDKAQECGHDWWNNDGGNGEVVIKVPSGKCSLTVNLAFTSYETHTLDSSVKR